MLQLKYLLPVLLSFLFAETISAQSRAETVTWINLRFRNSGLIKDSSTGQTTTLRINRDGSFELKNNVYRPGDMAIARNLQSAATITGSFKEMDPNTVSYTLLDNQLFIYANCLLGKNCIRQIETRKDKSVDSVQNISVMFGPVVVDNEPGMAIEAVKAFRRLISLDSGIKLAE